MPGNSIDVDGLIDFFAPSFSVGVNESYAKFHSIYILCLIITSESVGAAAVVMGDSVDAHASVLAGRRPALVPIRLALAARVPVDAVARVSAALRLH